MGINYRVKVPSRPRQMELLASGKCNTVKYCMKEARLQTLVLMNKNHIQRRVFVRDEVARHTEVQQFAI